ncbi:MAG: hypothetical protein K1X94_21870 [Sandaracinaceae bacterium]|nr:hypothetical protein [Sandaracinaceae bacterium]
MTTRWLGLARVRAVDLLTKLALIGGVASSALGCFSVHHDDDAGVLVDGLTPPDAPALCHTLTPTEVRTPRVLLDDQRLAVTTFAAGAGCGCSPRVQLTGSARTTVVLEACDCCEECECVDPGYEASTRDGGPLSVGTHVIDTALGPRALLVTTREQSVEVPAEGLSLAPVSDAVLVGGLELRWLSVQTTVSVCCVEPLVALDAAYDSEGVLVLTPRQVLQEDCACLGEPTNVTAWWPLEVGSGVVVRAGAREIVIPGP